jgi:hypothetical protein
VFKFGTRAGRSALFSVASAALDGKALADCPVRVPLVDDGGVHKVRVVLGFIDLSQSSGYGPVGG